MNTARISPEHIAKDWGGIAEKLWPAIRQDPSYNVQSLYNRLMVGTALLFRVSDGANGYWVVSLDSEVNQNGVNELIAWTEAISGQIDGGPTAKRAAIRQAVDALEQVLKLAGVKAHRLCGRDWSAILPQYAPYAGVRNGLERRI